MDESDKPKLPWFQFHLATAVLMMLAAGVFIGINFVNHIHGDGALSMRIRFGFPCVAILGHNPADAEILIDGLLKNIFVGIVFVAVVALISEFLIRRREGRKP